MKFFQCMIDMNINYFYQRVELLEGQLLRTADPKLIKFLENHRNVRVITDERLKKLSPPLQYIKQPEDPYRMRKEDILNELRSYGIMGDRFAFSEKLSMQLQIARKMKRRNFLTVLNEKNIPVYIDRANIPMPSLNRDDDALEEPEEPEVGEYFELIKEKESVKEVEKPKQVVEKKNKKEDDKFAAAIDPISDDDQEKNKGKIEFTEWISEETSKIEIEKEKQLDELLFSEQIPIIESEQIEFKERQKGIENEDIIEQNYRKFIDIDPNKPFMLNPLTTEDLENIREIKWTKISIDVIETILRNEGIDVTNQERSTEKRWRMVDKLKELLESKKEKEQYIVMMNMLQKRYLEIESIEPNFRKFKDQGLKKRLTELTRYGMNISYNKDTNIRSYAQKIFGLIKIGLNAPDTEDEIDELLKIHNKGSLVK